MSRISLVFSLNELKARVYLVDGIYPNTSEIEIRRCTKNRTKMGSIYHPYPRVRDELLCRTLPNLAGVTNASVTHPITGSPSIYEVLAVFRRAMARQVRERRKNRKRKRRMIEEGNVLSLTLYRFPLIALRAAKNLKQRLRGSKDGEIQIPRVTFLFSAIGNSPTEMRPSSRPILPDRTVFTYRRRTRVTREDRRRVIK